MTMWMSKINRFKTINKSVVFEKKTSSAAKVQENANRKMHIDRMTHFKQF